MNDLSAIEDKLNDNLKNQAPFLAGIELLDGTSIANWVEAENVIITNGRLTLPNDQSIMLTGTTNLFDMQGTEITAAFTQNDNALRVDLSIHPPATTKLSMPPGLSSWFDIEDLLLTVTAQIVEVNRGSDAGSPALFNTFVIEFGGTIRLDEITLPIILRLPLGNAKEWVLEGDFESLTLTSGLQELTKLAGGDSSWMDSLPPQIQGLGNFAIHDVQISFDPAVPSVSQISLEISADALEVVPEKLAIENFLIGIDIFSPTDSTLRDFQGVSSGTIHLGGDDGVDLYLSAELPGVRFIGALSEGSTLNLTEIFSHLLPGVTTPEGAPDITLHDLKLIVDVPTKSFAFYARCFTDWEILPKIVLSSVQIDLNYVNGALDDVVLIGAFTVGGVDVVLSAAHPPANAGWQFEGSTGQDQRIPLSVLVEDLGKKFGAFTLPNALEGLDIENLHLSFNTGSKDFTFSGEVKVPLEDRDLDLTLVIEIMHDLDVEDTYNKHFGLSIGNLLFQLDFPSDGGFVGQYQGHQKIDLQGLVDELLPQEDFTDLPQIQLDLTDAVLYYFSDKSDKTKSVLFFALNMGGGDIDKLGELPVIGEYLATYKLSIDYLISISSGKVTNEQVRAINGKLRDGFKLPEAPEEGQPAIRTGFNVLATIDLGGEPLQLTSGGNGTSPEVAQGGGNSTAVASSPVLAENQSMKTESPVTWKTLQRSVGPLYFSRVGFQYQDAKLSFLLDASINIAVLTFSLQGLSISSPLENFKPELGLTGFGLSYRSGPLEIAGEFIRQEDEFSGAAIIKAQTFSLTAFGSYSESFGAPSMFLYALLDKELGGPAFFYVTGLAFGFGYNRDLLLPPLAGVAKFPLVEAANSPPGSQPQLKSPGGMLTKLKEQQIIPPKVGSYWIAAGVRFSSFQFIESFALLLVKFGHELEFLLMGLSTLRLPKATPGAPKPDPYLYVEMQFMVSVKPQEGVFRAEAQLTDNSYLIDPSSKLSGGFAFYAWFAGEHNGDFVLTVGGYHPNFVVPDHYPQRQNVPPVSINWPLPKYNLSIKGTAYFAMTPSSIMAGGTLEAIYNTELIWASFTARANFLINWKPFHYDIDLSISVHVRATLDPPGVKAGREALQGVVDFFAEAFNVEPPKLGPITINTSLSAGLHLWGPPFAGTAHIQWEMISFDVEFGAAQSQGHRLLRWDEFEKAFLPDQSQPICQVNLGSGLVGELDDGAWVVDPESLAFTTSTFIPATQIELVFGNTSLSETGGEIGFRAMGSGLVTSTHTITISRGKGDSGQWVFETRRQGIPAEIWDPVNNGKEPTPSSTLLPGRVVGVNKLRPKVQEAPGDDHATPELHLLTFKFDRLKDKILPPILVLEIRTNDIPERSFEAITDSAMAQDVFDKRMEVFAAARASGFPLNENIGKLDILVASVVTSFQSPPMTGNLGSTGTRDQKFLRARSLPAKGTQLSSRQTAVRLTALLYQYRYLSMAMQVAHVHVDEAADEEPAPATAGVNATIAGGRQEKSANQARYVAVGGHIVKPAKGLVDQEILRQSEARFAEAEQRPPALDKHNLEAGQSQVWQLTPDDPDKPLGTALEINRSAGQRLRIVSLDRFSRPINDEILSGNVVNQLHPIDPKTAHILVTGLPMETVPPDTVNSVQQTTGWHGKSTLIQIQPRVYVGERVLVRAQASQQRLAASHPGVDLVGGMTAVNQNLRVDRNGKLTSGWLRTYLRVSGGQPPQTLAVSVRHSSLAAQAHPNTMVRVTDSQGKQRDLLPAFIVRESEAELVLLYLLPGNLRIEKLSQSDDGYFMVLTESTTGWVVDGVMSIHARPGQVRAGWAEYQLRESVIQAESAAAQEPAQVRVVVAD